MDIANFMNNRLSSLNRFLNIDTKGQYLTDIWAKWGHGEKVKSGDLQSMVDAFSGWASDCVDVRATKVASTPMKIYKPVNSNIDKPVDKHPFYELIKHPNSYQSQFDFLYLLQAYPDITGSAYIYIGKNRYGRPSSLELLLPHKTRKFIEEGEIVYEYTGTGKYQKFTDDEIIHVKYPNPKNPMQGLSPMERARMPINLIEYMEQFLLSLMANRARPDLILRSEQDISEKEAKRVSMSWKKKHSGIDKAGSIAVMGSGLDIRTLSLAPSDVQFLESKKEALMEISAAYKVPKYKLGEVEDVNKSNAHELELSFQRDTITPLLNLRDLYFTNDIISLYDRKLIIKSEEVVPVDKEFRREQESMDLNQGVITINEVRKRRGLEPVPYGDGIYKPFNVVHIDGSISQSPTINQPQKDYRDIDIYTKILSDAKINEMKEKLIEMHLKRQGKNEKRMVNELRDFFDRQEKEILKKLHKYSKDIKNSDVYLPPIRDENDKIIKLLEGMILAQVIEGGEAIVDDFILDIPFNGESPAIQTYLKHRQKKIIDINNTTFEKLKISLSEGQANGETIKQLSKRVEDIFDDAKGTRAIKIARTETNTAINYGHIEAMRQADIEKKEWITAGDDKVRDTHVTNETAGCIAREEAFPGTGEMYPGEVNCRCEVIPCLKEF